MLATLERITSYRQLDTYRKIRELADVAQARPYLASASLIFILVLSLVITRSVTKPISPLKQKTQEISNGKFRSKPAYCLARRRTRDLAASLNLMCRKLDAGKNEG